MSELAKLYDDAYKDATAAGEHHRGAHQRALSTIYEMGIAAVRAQPWRALVYQWLTRLRRRIRP